MVIVTKDDEFLSISQIYNDTNQISSEIKHSHPANRYFEA